MANQEDMERAKAGKEVWNAWAEEELKKPMEQWAEADFSGLTFSDIDTSSYIDFSGFVFPGNTYFKDAKFKDVTFFQEATFKSDADFRRATFEDVATFEDATFESLAFFEGTTFKGLAYFKNTKFNSRTIFNNAAFKARTFFTDTYFEEAPWFHNAVINQDTVFSFGEDFFRLFPDIESRYAERAYRTLKLAMSKYQSHTEEAGFFKLELMARAKKEKKWHQKWLYGAYGLFSDYGLSILRPFICWAVLGVAMFVLYALILGNPGESFTVTLSQALPLIGVEKGAYYDALKILFPDGTPIWFQIIRALHIVTSYFFIFLALLALRNRFKIK